MPRLCSNLMIDISCAPATCSSRLYSSEHPLRRHERQRRWRPRTLNLVSFGRLCWIRTRRLVFLARGAQSYEEDRRLYVMRVRDWWERDGRRKGPCAALFKSTIEIQDTYAQTWDLCVWILNSFRSEETEIRSKLPTATKGERDLHIQLVE